MFGSVSDFLGKVLVILSALKKNIFHPQSRLHIKNHSLRRKNLKQAEVAVSRDGRCDSQEGQTFRSTKAIGGALGGCWFAVVFFWKTFPDFNEWDRCGTMQIFSVLANIVGIFHWQLEHLQLRRTQTALLTEAVGSWRRVQCFETTRSLGIVFLGRKCSKNNYD